MSSLKTKNLKNANISINIEQKITQTVGHIISRKKLLTSAKMFFKILYIGILVMFISTYVKAIRQKTFIPKQELAPIKIDTSQVIRINETAKPFTVYSESSSLEEVKNTGYAITFYPLPFARTHITGGLLGNKIYKIHRNFLHLNQKSHGDRSGSTVDGKGFRVEGIVIFYNEQYVTYENALNFPDGLVVLSEPVVVGSKPNPNPDFQPFEKILLSGALRKPNSSTITSSKNIFSWYSTLSISHKYFVYPGSFYDPNTRRQISQAICVVTQPPYNFISEKQFAAFKHVLGVDGKPIETITPIYGRGSRKVEGAEGVENVALPFSQIVLLLQIGFILLFGKPH